jgi:flagellar biogenesis protein FliO
MLAKEQSHWFASAAVGLALVLFMGVPAHAQDVAAAQGNAVASNGPLAASDIEGPPAPNTDPVASGPKTEAAFVPAPASPAPEAPALEAVASNPAEAEDKPASGLAEVGFPIIKTIGAVGLVLSLAIVGYVSLRKFAPQHLLQRNSGKMLRLVETLPMGEKRSISIIEVRGKKLLIGNTPNQLSLLAPLDEEVPLESKEKETAPVPNEIPSASAARRGGKFLSMRMPGKKLAAAPKPANAHVIPPDLRGKMRELRAALES